MEDLTVFLRRMPKVELHVHLESTMPGEMLARFASRQGRELPRPAEQLYDCSAADLSDFLSFLDGICSFVGTPEELTEAAEHAALAAGEENILPVDAAFPALDAVKWKGLVQPYFEGVVMVYDMF